MPDVETIFYKWLLENIFALFTLACRKCVYTQSGCIGSAYTSSARVQCNRTTLQLVLCWRYRVQLTPSRGTLDVWRSVALGKRCLWGTAL